jgi:integrase
MRLLEALRLRVKDVDFAYDQITIRDGKGAKDRVTMLPVSLKAELREHLKKVKLQHEADLRAGLPAERAVAEVSGRGGGVGVAVRVSGVGLVAGSPVGRAPAASPL